MQNEIRQSIVEATIVKYRHFGEATDLAVRTYVEKDLERKNESIDIRKRLEDKKEEEIMKKELNQAAEIVVQRIKDKLRGTEFPIRPGRANRVNGQGGGLSSNQQLSGSIGTFTGMSLGQRYSVGKFGKNSVGSQRENYVE